jgi:hypothetical protein
LLSRKKSAWWILTPPREAKAFDKTTEKLALRPDLQTINLVEAEMIGTGEILEKSFVCKCQKIRITVQMLPGRTFPLNCRFCRQGYEITEKNGQILVEAEGGQMGEINNRGVILQFVGG